MLVIQLASISAASYKESITINNRIAFICLSKVQSCMHIIYAQSTSWRINNRFPHKKEQAHDYWSIECNPSPSIAIEMLND